MTATLFGSDLYTADRQAFSLDRRLEPTPALYAGADPWVTRHGDTYFFCNARHDGRLEVWRSDDVLSRGKGKTVWAPPKKGWNSKEVWAPELHYLMGRWYIYYAASDGKNKNHRMGVLAARTDDPQGDYEDLGVLYTGDDIDTHRNNRWAIDGTPLQLRGQLYFVWSGWEDERDIQHLYIAKMSDPTMIASNRVRMAPNDCHRWERVSESHTERGLHEGPALLRRNGRIYCVYSCSASWQHHYKLGVLHMPIDADPMNPASWTKHHAPVLAPTPHHLGVGHCSFTTDLAGNDMIFYHAKKTRREGWNDRIVHARPFGWTEDGMPDFESQPAVEQPFAPRRAA